ncbi:MAG: hypothetical protein HC913_15245 [Microscillaceae bacterium]|nr:hypothetical protein [Microscillaceae bacterium]
MMILCFLLATAGFTLITWLTLESIGRSRPSSSNDDDGGLFQSPDFPLIDLPPGGVIEDLLADRAPGDRAAKPNIWK